MIKSLDKLVQLAQISGGINVHCHFQGEWQIQHQDKPAQAIAHIITEGEGWLKVADDTQNLHVKQGDIVFLVAQKRTRSAIAQQGRAQTLFRQRN